MSGPLAGLRVIELGTLIAAGLPPRPARFILEMRDPAWDRLFTPVVRLVGWLADRIDGLQFMTIRQYLSLMFFALVLLLVMVAVSQ